MTLPGFFNGTGMPDAGWWEALWPEPAAVLRDVGLAPGTAFGPGAESYMRLCFARSPESLGHAIDRLTQWLKR